MLYLAYSSENPSRLLLACSQPVVIQDAVPAKARNTGRLGQQKHHVSTSFSEGSTARPADASHPLAWPYSDVKVCEYSLALLLCNERLPIDRSLLARLQMLRSLLLQGDFEPEETILVLVDKLGPQCEMIGIILVCKASQDSLAECYPLVERISTGIELS
jgi:hypothetical protein